MMQLDTNPTAESSYARTLIARGCDEFLAKRAAEILAQKGKSKHMNLAEEQIISRAYAQLNE